VRTVCLLLLGCLLPLAAPAQVLTAPAVPSCEVFTRASGEAPAAVRDWLQRSGDARVRVCHGTPPAPEARVFTGEGAVNRSGAVCSFTSHGLVPPSGRKPQLARYDKSEMVAMALAEAECPPVQTSGAFVYVMTYETTPQRFESLLRWWLAASSTPTALQLPPITPGSAGERLRNALAVGRLRQAPVVRVVRIPGELLRQRYTLFVADPAGSGPGTLAWVIYLSKRPRSPWQITAIADTHL
jgi:hypothetical protein